LLLLLLLLRIMQDDRMANAAVLDGKHQDANEQIGWQ
jgi:hypothetical protein